MDAVALDHLQHLVLQVVSAFANQIFLEPSALHALHHIMAIQIATVRVNFFTEIYFLLNLTLHIFSL